ncbi:MAG: tRNA lysidine(34) synthetase TilS [Candidatus Humimicrobiaceae bacterium]|jgi:tRNA(Ile)-lysidine synthase|nr:tRNA lysidine(34) synthetase TilS [Candidatus Humimicrobiaceae bacterium]
MSNIENIDFNIKEIQKEMQNAGFSEFAGEKVILKALKTIESNRMLERGDRVLISISGGPDSTFLTHLFYILRPVYNLTLFGFSLDHMTRDGESTQDALFVKKLCEELDIKLFEEKIDVEKWCRLNKLSFQEGARRIRIEKLLEISKEHNIERVATGHNADDNIETFFINLFRGSGAGGISGIKPVSGKFIRPLIEIQREEIVSYLNKKEISYCVDRTNVENIYFRNRVRNILIPYITRHFGGSFKKNILKLLDILRDEDDFLKQYAADVIREIASIKYSEDNKKPALIKMPVLDIKKKHRSIQRRVIMMAVEMIRGSSKDISFKNIDDILKICVPGGESKVVIPGENIRVFKISDHIYFASMDCIENLSDELVQFLENKGGIKVRGEKKEVIEERKRKKAKGKEEIGQEVKEAGKKKDREAGREEVKGGKERWAGEREAGGKEVKIGTPLSLDEFNMELHSEILEYDKNKINVTEAGDMEAFMDYAKIRFPIKVRSRERLDKFHPLGMEGEKKLKDFFIDKKIPVHLRGSIPVFVDKEKIIWVGTLRIDNRVRVTDDTKKILHLKLYQKWQNRFNMV